MKILFVAPLSAGSGNSTTSKRICSFLNSANHEVELVNALENPCFQIEGTYDLGILLHAFKAGSFWQKAGLSIPYIVIYGGTDLNIDVTTDHKASLIENIVTKAMKRICFTKDFVQLASTRWPSITHSFQAQSISLPQCHENFVYSRRSELVIVAGLRPVKDIHFGIDCFEKLREDSTRNHLRLMIIGPAVDPVYAEAVFARIEKSTNIEYIPFLEQEKLFERVSRALCSINSSLSEGQSAAILESMALGVPVLARNIGGNRFIEATNTLYDCPITFCQRFEETCSNEIRWKKTSEDCVNFIKKNHSPNAERDFYLNVIDEAKQTKL